MKYHIGHGENGYYVVGENGWIKGPYATKGQARYALAEIEVGEDEPPVRSRAADT